MVARVLLERERENEDGVGDGMVVWEQARHKDDFMHFTLIKEKKTFY